MEGVQGNGQGVRDGKVGMGVRDWEGEGDGGRM